MFRLTIVTVLLLMSSSAYYSYRVIYDLALESLKKNAFLETQRGATEIDVWLSRLKIHVNTLASTDVVRSMKWKLIEPYLRTEVPRFQGTQTIAVGKPDGWREAVGTKPANVADRQYFKKAMQGYTNVSDPLINRAMKTPSIGIAAPIYAKAETSGHPIGEIHSFVKLDRVSQIVNQVKFSPDSYAFALSSEGKAIVHPNPLWISTVEKPALSLVKATDPALARIAQQMIEKQQGIQLVKLNGTWKYVAYVPLKEAEWSIALVIPREDVEAPLKLLNLLAAVIVGLSATLIVFLWQMQSSEQKQLKRSNEILEQRVAERTEELSVALEQLQQSQAQLQKANEILEQRVTERTEELSAALKELKTSQLQLVQTEKMSSLGQLVAGVAHEINNPINFIHGNVIHIDSYTHDLLKVIQAYQSYYPNPPQALLEILDAIEFDFLQEDLIKLLQSLKIGTDRIRQIVLSLRNFSRLDEAEFKAVDIHEGIDTTLLILQHRLKARPESPAITVVKNYGQLPLIECYAGQLNQVFINLLANAIDALQEAAQQRQDKHSTTEPWIISITTQVTADNQVQIIIADNGLGIPESVQARLFDPFFTTKPVGKGTGLGLSISYQIVTEKHRGRLWCDSTPGKGTKFVIEFPVKFDTYSHSGVNKPDLL